MEQDIKKNLEEQDAKLDAIFVPVEKTRKYFLINPRQTNNPNGPQ